MGERRWKHGFANCARISLLRKIPTASFAANALYLEIVRLAYNLVTAFQRTCLMNPGTLTLQKLRYKFFLFPAN